MRDRPVARLLRLARIRLDLRQVDVGQRADLSRTSVAEHELGRIEGSTVRSLRRHAEAIGLTLEILLRGQTGELVQDEEHALLTQWVQRQLALLGWTSDAEASYSIFGERGRVDLLGWHAGRRIVLIDEQKTDLPDVQDVLGSLDVKERLAKRIAAERGWNADSVAVMLVITRTSRNVRTVQRFGSLFARYSLRGTSAVRWLRDPHGSARLLIFVPPSAVGRNGRKRVARRASRSAARRPNVDVVDLPMAASPRRSLKVGSTDVDRAERP